MKLKLTKGADVYFGTSQDDFVFSGLGNDTLYGYDGADTLLSYRGHDVVFGGAGDDVIKTRWGRDFVDAGEGDDFIHTARGRDTVYGGSGNDTVFAGRGQDVVFGDDGNDNLWGMRKEDRLYGGAGDDRLVGGRHNDHLDGGDGFDIAIFHGPSWKYEISEFSKNGEMYFKIRSLDRSVTDWGTDTLIRVEAAYFRGDNVTVSLVQNQAPTAIDDTITVLENETSIFTIASLLANDTDPDGDSLTLVSIDLTTIEGGSVRIEDGNLVYTQPADISALQQGEERLDSFTYSISDGNGHTSTATVHIRISGVNDAPILSVSTEFEVTENTTYVVQATFSDVDGVFGEYAISGGPDASLLSIDQDGHLSFVAAPDFEAPRDADADNTYSVEISVTDEFGGVDTQEVSIAVTDVDEIPPVSGRINEIHYQNVGEDVGEFIEVRIQKGDDVSQVTLDLYDDQGNVYDTLNLENARRTQDAGYDYYVIQFEADHLSNGPTSGLALSNGGQVIEFLSYGGALYGQEGLAQGLLAAQMETTEAADTAIGHSLQREADGTWRTPVQNSMGVSNDIPLSNEIRINEFHYDNAGTDANEFVEIRTSLGFDVTDASIYLYNGSTGRLYNEIELADLDPTYDGNHSFYVWDLPVNGIQNAGSTPDGIALVQGGEVVEFLSYEGEFIAKNGPAEGLSSNNINVAESITTTETQSLQRNDFGVWTLPNEATKGYANLNTSENGFEIRINEFHYDDAGQDDNEFVEIRVEKYADVSDVRLDFVNGGNGSAYASALLSDADFYEGDQFDFYVVRQNNIQDGSPDGMVLFRGDELIEFISYEGQFIGNQGASLGVLSVDVQVSESDETPEGYSLQRNEDGEWIEPTLATLGSENNIDFA